MISPYAQRDLFTLWFGRGCKLALHYAQPGPGGGSLLLGPVNLRAGTFALRAGRVTNPQTIDLGSAPRSGTATHFSIWRGKNLLLGAALPGKVALVAGATVLIPRGALEVTLG